MKIISKVCLSLLIVGLFACSDDLDEKLSNPNEVDPQSAELDDLYNSVQLGMRNLASNTFNTPAGLSRMIARGSYNYVNTITPNTGNGLWGNVYAGLWPDIEALITIADERGLTTHSGTARIMKAYSMMVMVDLFGDMPYTESLQGTDIISPAHDGGASIYAAAVALIVEGIAQLEGPAAASPGFDNFYGGDTDKWIALGNTLQLRAAVTTRLVDSGAGGKVAALLSKDLIDEASEDFQFNFGTSRSNPNARHNFYNNAYETGDGSYMSTYYMWLLAGEKQDAGIAVTDPRIRYYFYRQTENASTLDQNVYSCHLSNLPDQAFQPDWYADVDPRMPYCIPVEGDGYFGRDHLNGEGIPPDGPIKTIYGLYPGGGQFDDSSFEDQQQSGTTGALGLGIWPMMLSSYVDFLRAEAALTLGTGEDAAALLRSGMEKSFAKVRSFENRDGATFSRLVDQRGTLISVKDAFAATNADVDSYITFVMDSYTAATTPDAKLNIVMKEYYIALWGNGIETYNMYRRTGMPNNMMPSLEEGPGQFLRSYLYPADHINRNSTITDNKNHFDPVFWDNGSADVY